MKIANTKDSNYKLIDFGDGFKYENINGVNIKRPDSKAYGNITNESVLDKNLDAVYNSEAGQGKFEILTDINPEWNTNYKDLTFKLKLTNYKHIGLFPEQSLHWDYVREAIENGDQPVKVLNLFAYSGAASINAAKAGAEEVVHVDALRQVNEWAKENSVLSGTEDKTIRYIAEDVITFLKREVKRGNKYQIIIMDPPSFGRGPKNQIWKFEDNLDELLKLTSQLLEDPICVLISTYTNHFDKNQLKQKLELHFDKDIIDTYDMVIESESKKLLNCGAGGICAF